jgi:hypothetical protein
MTRRGWAISARRPRAASGSRSAERARRKRVPAAKAPNPHPART